jgi:hypothetical protein
MQTFILLISILSITKAEAEQFAKDSTADLVKLEAELALKDKIKQPIILSAALCEAQARLNAIKETARARGYSNRLKKAFVIATHDIHHFELALGVFDVAQVSCTYTDVERLVQCIGPAAPFWCEKEHNMVVLVKAKELIPEDF